MNWFLKKGPVEWVNKKGPVERVLKKLTQATEQVCPGQHPADNWRRRRAPWGATCQRRCSPHANIVVVMRRKNYRKPKYEIWKRDQLNELNDVRHMPTSSSSCVCQHMPAQATNIVVSHMRATQVFLGYDISRHHFINWTGVLLDYLSISIPRLTNQEKPQDTKIWMLVSR